MITIALFNRGRGIDSKGTGVDKLIRKGSESFRIEFCFIMNKQEYIIIREKNKSNQTLQLYINNKDFTGKLTETQNKINEIIKMDYETFMDTICIGQSMSGDFMSKKPSERKKVISDILRLDTYEILENYTKEQKKSLKNKIDLLNTYINNDYDKIKNKKNYEEKIKVLKVNIKEINKQIKLDEKELEKILIEKTKYEELKKQQDNIILRKNKINNNINIANDNIIKFENIKSQMQEVILNKDKTINSINILNKEIEENNKEKEELNDKLNNYNININILSSDINNLTKKINNLQKYNKGICDFCGQEISEEYKENHVSEMNNLLNKNNDEYEILKNKLIDLRKSINIYINNIRDKENELNDKQKYLSKIEVAEVKLDNVKERIIDENNKLNEYNKEKEELNNITVVDLSDKQFNDNQLRSKINNSRNELNDNTSMVEVLKNQIEEIKELEAKYKKNSKELKELKNKLNNYDELQKAWSNKGIPADIIANILPQIEEEINKYLNILSNGNISIKFITEKEAKNGNKSDTLDIVVSDSYGERAYELYSGGERKRIDFACHIGMAKFLAKRAGANIDFFVVDEGIGTLDENGKNAFIDTINLLTTMFKQIMVISHIEQIQESFNNKVIVTKDKIEGSKVSILE